MAGLDAPGVYGHHLVPRKVPELVLQRAETPGLVGRPVGNEVVAEAHDRSQRHCRAHVHCCITTLHPTTH